jgi:signal transduction histidine kinase
VLGGGIVAGSVVLVGGDPGIGTNGKAGFGLVGTSERAKAMNGTMSIESTPGKGTTLTVVIPRSTRS